ncbi:hypothetical protein OZ410_02755 [Robiginitalea sp. M366]|uniref:hypothetical protein n=1 Tax=Robiginitalea aestuariiviva TaxID=3036903 RepID=UPI00240D0864|nr:hypothetical protein [Robiginitalea aestuariiviva]MDG1571219.1 hypothetical protein [Robiginitalea aestuariiviva]
MMAQSIRLAVVFLLFFVNPRAWAQDSLAHHAVEVSLYGTPSSSLAITDHASRTLLVYTYPNAFSLLEYDGQFNLTGQQTIYKEVSGFDKSQGYALEPGGTLHLYFSKASQEEFLVVSLAPDGSVTRTTVALPMEKEKPIDAISHNGRFHLLTYTQKSSIVNRYTFSGTGVEKVVYDLGEAGYCEKWNGECDLRDVFKKGNILFVEPDLPTPLGEAVKTLKIYPQGNRLKITTDHRLGTTVLFDLSLDTNQYAIRYYGFDYHEFPLNGNKKSNSFLYGNHLYQILVSRKQAKILVKDLADNRTVKTLTFNQKDPIAFLNSEIYQDNGSFSSASERLSSEKQFLATLMDGRVGITAEPYYGKTKMVFGGTRTRSTPMYPGIPLGSFQFGSLNIGLSFFISASNSEATYARALLNPENLEQAQGFAGINIFETLAVYKQEEAQLKGIDHENVFLFGDRMIYGYNRTKEKTFTLMGFSMR